MAYSASGLPTRFPVGTKFVIEGRAGGDLSRFIEFPDGTKLRLPNRPSASARLGGALASRASALTKQVPASSGKGFAIGRT